MATTYSQLLVRNKLARPLNLEPGVPTNHVAIKGLPGQAVADIGGTLRFSAIMPGGNGIRANPTLPMQLYPRYGLLAGINVSGPTGIFDGLIGPATVHSASGNNYGQWTNFVPPNDVTITMACIVRMTSTSGSFFCGNSLSGTGSALTLSSGVLNFGIPFGAGIASGLPALQAGHAYLLVVSATSSSGSTTVQNKQSCLQVDLVTGVAQVSKVAGSITTTAPTSGVQWGDAGGNNASSFGGYMAAMMFSNTFLTTQELLIWAQDPWSFWYPQSNNNLVTLILESLQGSQAGLPKNQYDWPLTVGRQYSPATYREYNFDQGSKPASLLAGLKPFKQDDWPVPFPPFDERRGQWNRSYDQSMSISRQLLVKSPITGPTQELPAQPFRPQVSGDLGSTQRLATIQAPITGPTQDLPIPPFRPQVSADLGSTQRLATIKAPITGPTQDLPIPPFRPQVSSDQGSTQWLATIMAPNVLRDWPLPIPPFRPQFSAELGSTQRLATIQPPNPRFDWQLPLQPFRPQFSFDQGNITFLTVTVTAPRNQYDWPLPVAPYRPFYGLIYNKAQQAGNQPFAQTDWPLPIPPFRPDATFLAVSPVWLTAVQALPFNLYDWPLPGSPAWRLYGSQYASQPFPINRPFNQYDWPLPIPPRRPDANFLSFYNPSQLIVLQPRNQYDWPLPIPPSTRLYGGQYATNIYPFIPPAGMQVYDLPPQPYRPDSNFTFFYRPPYLLLGPKVFSQNDWPLPIPPFRPQFSADLPALTLLSEVFMALPPEWVLPAPIPYRDYSFMQGLNPGTMFVPPFPHNQYDWPLPIPPFRIDQTSTLNYNPTQMLTGKKPFAQVDWPLPILNPYGNVTIYTIVGPNNPNIYPPTPTTVKIEWLIRARRRGRR